MNRITVLLVGAHLAGAALAGPFDAAEIRGVTDRDPVSYKAGETIDFTLSLVNAKVPQDEAYFVQWTRTGDDGKKASGREPAATDMSFHVRTSLAKPGFVRLEARLVDAAGKEVVRDRPAPGENWFGHREVFFSGGAGVDIAKLRQGAPEPRDFDRFWAKQKARLKAVPVKAERTEVASPRQELRVYAVRVECAGGHPVTGYLSVPKRCDSGAKCGARVSFDGYGSGDPKPPKQLWDTWNMEFHINAHGYELGKDKAYYDEFLESIKSNGKGYAFDPRQNSDPEKAYFNGMALRVMRALEYVKTLPEWDGKTLIASGGSQGGLQTMWAAALDRDVTEAQPMITWCSDIGKRGEGRQGAEFEPQYTDALRYYDTANHARRITCKVNCTRAGLGDYTCPPSGLAVVYNNLKCPKSCNWTQGSRHGYIPPNPVIQTVSSK